MFQLDETYTRDEISKKLGGSKQKYLPHCAGQVVCGCFRKDLNPKAPGEKPGARPEVLPGKSPDRIRWARVFAEQRYPVPIFIKESTNNWQYRGGWRVSCTIKDKCEIKLRAEETSRSDISMILRLERA